MPHAADLRDQVDGAGDRDHDGREGAEADAVVAIGHEVGQRERADVAQLAREEQQDDEEAGGKADERQNRDAAVRGGEGDAAQDRPAVHDRRHQAEHHDDGAEPAAGGPEIVGALLLPSRPQADDDHQDDVGAEDQISGDDWVHGRVVLARTGRRFSDGALP